ncbi:MAG: hypothetical protein PUF18_03305 [Methanosphaera sp.]|uniref:beta strand repeat-containing protein n=1 Tax=Methanosphaera sp. TaxID=2666342 RepID=UPI00260D77D0|nr:hypothetical protein [Methanosphaera sp.]MDD6534517.1 hypothetical protein [Methanosphaera sp.]
MSSKKSILLTLMLFFVFIVGLTASCAADSANSSVHTTADTISADTVSVDTVSSDIEVKEKTIPNKEIKSNIKENKKQTKNVDKTTKKATTHVITNSTIGNYFIKDNNYSLADNVVAGDTLDIQGNISNLDDKNFSMIVNKPVNIISSTKDAYIDLNTTAGSLLGENPGTAFNIINGANGTNMSGIYLHNTQFWISGVSNVVINNISAVVEDQRVGSGVGQTSIRNNATNITLKNSFIYTRNNGGSSSVVIAWADYCTIENNTIQGEGNVGNLFYLTTYNVNLEIPNGTIVNSNNKFINNHIIGPQIASNICGGIYVCGSNNTIANNIVDTKGVGLTTQWGTNLVIENYTIENNTFNQGASISAASIRKSVYRNNTVTTGRTIIRDSVAENNKFLGSCTITNCNLTNNTIKGALTISNSSNVTGNSLETLYITSTSSKDNVIENNRIIAKNTTKPVTIKSTNNTFKNNYVVGITTPGDEALDIAQGNIVENTTPVSNTVTITEENFGNYFDNDGNLLSEEIRDFTTINIQGTLTDRKFIISNLMVTIEGIDATLNNGKITLEEGAVAYIKNIKFNTEDIAIELNSDDSLIENVTINTSSSDAAIAIDGNGNTVTKSTITLSNETSAKAVTIKGSNNKITNNNITSNKAASVNAIIVDGDSVGNNILSNTITINNATDAKAVVINGKFNHSQVSSNNIYINATNVCAIDATGDMESAVINTNKIFVGTANTFKAIAIKGNLDNVTVNSNNIQTKNTTTINAIEVIGDFTNKAQIARNTINITNADSIVAVNVTGTLYSGSFVSTHIINITGKNVIGITVDKLTNSTELRSNSMNITATEQSDANVGIIVSGENYTVASNTVNGNVLPLKVYDSENVRVERLYGNITQAVVFSNVTNNSSFINSNINSTANIALKLIDSKKVNVTNNVFKMASKEFYGNNAVEAKAEDNNIIYNNKPYMTSLKIEGVDNLKVDVPVEITITILDENNTAVKYSSSQSMIVSINGQKTTIKATTYTFTLTPSAIENIIEVEFNDKNNYYAPISETNTYNATIGTPKIIISGHENLKIDEPSEITITVVDENNNTINADNFSFNVSINGEFVEVNSTSYTFTLTPDVIKNTIRANFTDNTGARENATLSRDIKAAKSDVYAPVKIDIQGLNLVVGKTSTVTITIEYTNGTQVPKLTDGSFIVYVGDDEYKVNDTTVTINITPTSTRKITVDIEYTDNTGRTRSTSQAYITSVAKRNATVTVDVNDTKIFEDINMSIKVLEDATAVNEGKAIIKIDDEVVGEVNVTNGVVDFTYENSTLPTGQHIVLVEFTSPNYNSYTANATFTITKYDIEDVTIEGFDVKVGKNTTITATIVDENGKAIDSIKDVEVLIDGISVANKTIIIQNGKLEIDIPTSSLKVGQHSVVVNIKEDEINYASDVSAAISIIKGNANINIQKLDVIYAGSNITLIAVVTDDEGKVLNDGKVAFKLNGKTLKDADGKAITVKVENGVAKLVYEIPKDYSAKDYKLTAVYESNTITRSEATEIITIQKANIVITPEALIYDEDGNLAIKASVKTVFDQEITNAQKVTVKVNGKAIINKLTINNGIIDIKQAVGIKKGEAKITIIVGENSKYAQSRIETSIYVLPQANPKTAKMSNSTIIAAKV